MEHFRLLQFKMMIKEFKEKIGYYKESYSQSPLLKEEEEEPVEEKKPSKYQLQIEQFGEAQVRRASILLKMRLHFVKHSPERLSQDHSLREKTNQSLREKTN
mmetsp:Transcript_43276/g.41662  ORF Transcript_43276/g.41662 Transcript_43276/m.41662 type:complete len:102 (+) Transcript_43276:325-630(+)